MRIPFPAFEPDKSPFNVSASGSLKNCLPVADGWGPMNSFNDVSEVLPDECLGGAFAIDSNGDVHIFAGTATALYKLNDSAAPYAWDVVTRLSGGYNVPTGDKWVFTHFGNYLIAHTLGDAPQFINVDNDTEFSDIPEAPTARYSWVAGDFLVFGHLENQPNVLQWSGINDIVHWEAGRNGSDIQFLPDGGPIMGGVGDQRGAVVIQHDKMRYMQFSPESIYTFTFSEANNSRGVIAPHSITQYGPNQFAYLSEDGFFVNVEGNPIGAEKVDNWFREHVDMDYLFDVKGMNDPFNKVIWWRFKAITGGNLLLGFDWQLGRWCYSDVNITEATALATPAITWDGLANQYASIDEVDIPFNSRLFSGGRPTFAAFTDENKLAFNTGSNLEVELESGEIELYEGHRVMVNGGRLVSDVPNFTVAIGGAEFHGGPVTYGDAVAPSVRTEFLPLRKDARLHRFKLEIPAGELWSIVESLELDISQGGKS